MMSRTNQKQRSRGAVLVEFALVLPVLLLLLLGIIEFGMLMMHQLTLMQAAREGVRLAAVRAPVASVTQRILNSSTSLPNQGEMVVALTYSTDNGVTFPGTLADNAGGENNAPAGTLIRVRVDCPHHLITGTFFSWLAGVQGDALPQHAAVVMRRE